MQCNPTLAAVNEVAAGSPAARLSDPVASPRDRFHGHCRTWHDVQAGSEMNRQMFALWRALVAVHGRLLAFSQLDAEEEMAAAWGDAGIGPVPYGTEAMDFTLDGLEQLPRAAAGLVWCVGTMIGQLEGEIADFQKLKAEAEWRDRERGAGRRAGQAGGRPRCVHCRRKAGQAGRVGSVGVRPTAVVAGV
jgi:hypothetical protein